MSSITSQDRSVAPGETPPAGAPNLPTSPPPSKPFLQRLPRSVGTLSVIAMLGLVALWGHQTDWTLPKFSALTGGSAAEAEDWCKEHNVPESQCIECQLLLAPAAKDFGWCKVHGVAPCPFEHPEAAQLKSTTEISSEQLDAASAALALRPRAENNSRCKLHQKRIQFASTEAVEKAGVDIAVAQQRPILEAIVANGEVTYDQTRTAHLASRVSGTLWRVEKRAGDKVEKGDLLALVDAADVGKAKSEFLQALGQLKLRRATADRLKPLSTDGSVPARQYREAEAAEKEAEIRLLATQQALVNLGLNVRIEDYNDLTTEESIQQIRFLGLDEAIVASFDAATTSSNLFPLRAPLSGVIVQRHAVSGEVVDNSTTLFSVTDLNHMWLTLNVRQEEAKLVAVGQRVLFRGSDSQDDTELEGSVNWISTAADDQTRTVQVKIDLPNTDGKLRANTFGAGRIVLREAQAVVAPTEAVHSEGCCNVVFVRDKDYLKPDAPKFFHVRKVRLGVKSGDTTEIIAGLLPGEIIASKNSVVLEAQLLKSKLGEGCGCCAPVKK